MKEENIILVFFKNNIWLLKIIFLFLFLIFIYFFLNKIIKIIKKKSKRKWVKKVDYIILKPAHLLIISLSLFYFLDIIASQLGFEKFLEYSKIIRKSFIVISISWLLLRWKKILENILFFKEKKILEHTTLDFVSKIFSFLIILLSSLIILQIFKINIMPLIAFGGVGAAAIGFAAKDVIANFFGGLMIYFTRPFCKGDYVDIPSQNILGTIENIGWYLTCIRDLEHCPIYLPNSVFSTVQIKNKTRRTHKKIEETIGIRYQDFYKLNDLIIDIKKLLEKEEKIDQSIPSIVAFTMFNSYSLDIIIRVYTYVLSYEDFMQTRQDILIKINGIIQKHKADIPFPTNTVKLT